MRELIEKEVIFNYNCGLDEIALEFLNYTRKKAGIKEISTTNIEEIVKEFTNEELLTALDCQMCQRYR